MNRARLIQLVAICAAVAGGCIDELPPRPAPEVPPYPQQKFDSPQNAWHQYARAAELLDRDLRRPEHRSGPLTPELIEEFAEYLKQQRRALAALEGVEHAGERPARLRPGQARESRRKMAKRGHARPPVHGACMEGEYQALVDERRNEPITGRLFPSVVPSTKPRKGACHSRELRGVGICLRVTPGCVRIRRIP